MRDLRLRPTQTVGRKDLSSSMRETSCSTRADTCALTQAGPTSHSCFQKESVLMRSDNRAFWLRGAGMLAISTFLLASGARGGSGSSSNNNNGNNQVIAGPGPNVVTLVADPGATGDYTNGSFVSATICLPGTTTCQTIDHLLVDTGSFGLRILSSAGGGALTLALPTV